MKVYVVVDVTGHVVGVYRSSKDADLALVEREYDLASNGAFDNRVFVYERILDQ